ncbi:threonine-phosphate decarboxylase CobD [Aureimonas sp. ME7]|uniref:threonine-phosphate decarboxylase CobD n=1 Tax=Aureimonas sp. ME7 TaxID=2744252 RepID=UPI0015F4A671|nr:threonine-phosphate decarboxylase CobD [Aureimonas sp. ME7]
MTTHLVHGGALGAAIARFGGALETWLDLSTGINPVPPPMPALSPAVFARLPERAAEEALIASACCFFGAGESAAIAIAPGSQALISLLPHLLPPAEAAILAPAYAEHARAFRAAGHRVRAMPGLGDLGANTQTVVMVNPNNPDGRRFARAELLALADQLAEGGGLLVVDEAFMDADPCETLSGDAGRPGLVVLRSFGKFFGLAGLRLGFALGEPRLMAAIAERLGPWAVSGPALAVGAALMGDAALVATLRRDIALRADLTRGAIGGAGLEAFGDAALFALVEVPGAHALFEALARRHILTRPFADQPNWLRIGQVRDEAEAERLRTALGDALAEIGA